MHKPINGHSKKKRTQKEKERARKIEVTKVKIARRKRVNATSFFQRNLIAYALNNRKAKFEECWNHATIELEKVMNKPNRIYESHFTAANYNNVLKTLNKNMYNYRRILASERRRNETPQQRIKRKLKESGINSITNPQTFRAAQQVEKEFITLLKIRDPSWEDIRTIQRRAGEKFNLHPNQSTKLIKWLFSENRLKNQSIVQIRLRKEYEKHRNGRPEKLAFKIENRMVPDEQGLKIGRGRVTRITIRSPKKK